MPDTTIEELDALKNELLGTVSHELRTPLAAISGNVALLLQDTAPLPLSEQRECLTEIAQAAQRLASAITMLIDVAQLTARTALVAQRPVSVAHLARDALAVARAAAPWHQVRLAMEPEMAARWVRGDAEWLRRALDQLLLNATQCTPEGGTITLGLHDCEVAGQAGVELAVQDTGSGIAAQHLPHLCEPFYRVDTRLTREVNGLGLGLALCQGVANAHGGALSIVSMVGQGSTFRLRLPVLVDPSA